MLIVVILYTGIVVYKLIPYLSEVKPDNFLEAYMVCSASLLMFGLDAWNINPIGGAKTMNHSQILHKIHGSILSFGGFLGALYLGNVI